MTRTLEEKKEKIDNQARKQLYKLDKKESNMTMEGYMLEKKAQETSYEEEESISFLKGVMWKESNI